MCLWNIVWNIRNTAFFLYSCHEGSVSEQVHSYIELL